MRVDDLAAFIFERESIRVKKERGLPKPWTEDKILQRHRFCNIRREDDAVTRWIAQHWRTPYENDANIWFLMLVARLVNWPDTLDELTDKLIFQGRVRWHNGGTGFVSVLHARRAMGEKVYGGAYIVSTNGIAKDKAQYLADQVLSPLWAGRDRFYSRTLGHMSSLKDLYEAFLPFNGMAGFMSAQVVADVKYTAPYREVRDWYDFAASGPGSRRGMNRMMHRKVDATWPRETWNHALYELAAQMAKLFKARNMERLHNQDLQNCLCEFDKYERTRLGEGFPRTRYPGEA